MCENFEINHLFNTKKKKENKEKKIAKRN